ncbi:349_t:CDS:2 [Gigaspora rosea]|nr:349_t:CDS:2 [Gigaspora rosea]
MPIKRKEKADREITNKRQKKKIKTLLKNNTTLNSFFILKMIPTKDRVKKVWDSLKEEEKFLLNNEFTQMHEEWLYLLKNELKSPYYLNIKRKLIEHEKKYIIIVGQDPYPNNADGLAFSSKQIKPLLRKIFNLME